MGRSSFFLILSSRDLGGCNQGGFCFIFLSSCSRNYRVCVFFSSSDWLWIFKSFLNLLGVDRFFVLIFRFVLQFFLWFFFSFHHFFSFFPFLRLSHLLWSFECVGDFFCFQYCFSLLLSTSLSFFKFFFFCFNFYVKEDNVFYIHFQRGSPQQWIRAKGSSKSFLTKAPTPPWHHWEQSTLFSIFLAFFYLFMYIYVHSYT